MLNLIRNVYKVIAIVFSALFALPFIAFAKLSDERGYYNLAVALATMPFFFGEKLRYYFYKTTLSHCGKNVVFKYGSSCLYKDIVLNNNIVIGLYTMLGRCTIEDNVLLGSYINITSGNQQHLMSLQNDEAVFTAGKRERVIIGRNVWVGNNAVILKSIAKNCAIGAGSVVVKVTEKNGIYVGNPASRLKDLNAN